MRPKKRLKNFLINKTKTMLLIFDTETDGLPKKLNGKITDADNWPRMLSIAWMLCDDNGFVREDEKLYIKNPGYKIDPNSQAIKVNGITQEMLDNGWYIDEAVLMFFNAVIKAEKLIAHNFQFDKNIILSEIARNNIMQEQELANLEQALESKKIDTMLDQKAITGKWPKLNELHRHLFGTDFDGAHDAMNDVKACARCYFELKKRNLI